MAEKSAQQSQESLGKKEQQKSPTDNLPPQSEEVRSSMEAGTEKKEGEVKAQFCVNPFYGGYYKQLLFNSFRPETLKWAKPENIFHPADAEAVDLLGSRILHGKISGKTPLSLPLPYGWT